ncbi:hypothetical protein, partial [Trichormus variabilis]
MRKSEDSRSKYDYFSGLKEIFLENLILNEAKPLPSKAFIVLLRSQKPCESEIPQTPPKHPRNTPETPPKHPRSNFGSFGKAFPILL